MIRRVDYGGGGKYCNIFYMMGDKVFTGIM